MELSQLCKMIASSSEKVAPLRNLAINGNNQKRRLFMAAILTLLSTPSTLTLAYQQIMLLAVSANLEVVNGLATDVWPHLHKTHVQHMDQYVVLWGKMYDAAFQKKTYPNVKHILNTIKVRKDYPQLSAAFKQHLLTFHKNFNQLKDQKVQFFQDFDDSCISQSVQNESRMSEIIYYDIMQVKAIKKRVQSQTLTQQQTHQILTKIKHFLTLKPDLVNKQIKTQYYKQQKWARQYLNSKESYLRKNQNVPINQTFQLNGDQESIQIIDKTLYAHRRTFKVPMLNQLADSQSRVSDIVQFTPGNFKKMRLQQLHIQSQQCQKKLQRSHKNLQNRVARPQKQQPNQMKQKACPKVSKARQQLRQNKNVGVDVGNRQLMDSYYQDRGMEEEEGGVGELRVLKYSTAKKNWGGHKAEYSATDHYLINHKHTGAHQQAPPLKLNEYNYQSQTMGRWKLSQYSSPTRKMSSSKCKLSQFTSQKKQRKQLAPKQELSIPEDYVILPYSLHFNNYIDFSRFRRNCFESSFTLYSSSLLIVSCIIRKQANSQIKLQILYANQSKSELQIQTIYKIPRCFKIQKGAKIWRKCIVADLLQHIFNLDISQFPLQACLLSLKYRPTNTNSTINQQIVMPITMRNFVDYLIIEQQQWISLWQTLSKQVNKELYHVSKHLQYDRSVMDSDEVEAVFREIFVHIGSIQGYSVYQYGCSCHYPHLDQLTFLMRLSIRVDNFISLEIISQRPVDLNQRDFIEYYLNTWLMLLGKFSH